MGILVTFLLIISGMQLQTQQMIIAHRGASYLNLENTLASVNWRGNQVLMQLKMRKIIR